MTRAITRKAYPRTPIDLAMGTFFELGAVSKVNEEVMGTQISGQEFHEIGEGREREKTRAMQQSCMHPHEFRPD